MVVKRGRGLKPPLEDNRAGRQTGNALDRRRREAGEVQPMRCEGFNLPSDIATLGHVRRSGFDSRAGPIPPRKSPPAGQNAGGIGAGDISGKVDIARTAIYRQSDWGGIRNMSGFDGSKQEIDIDSFGEAVDAVWDGPGTYEIEPLVCSACPLDVTCFDREGLECELVDMYRHELDRRDKVEIRLINGEL